MSLTDDPVDFAWWLYRTWRKHPELAPYEHPCGPHGWFDDKLWTIAVERALAGRQLPPPPSRGRQLRRAP